MKTGYIIIAGGTLFLVAILLAPMAYRTTDIYKSTVLTINHLPENTIYVPHPAEDKQAKDTGRITMRH